jgi:tRNA nucleotidyltransferase/poly(A) polymerase
MPRPLSDLLVEQKDLEKQIRKFERRLETVKKLIDKASPTHIDELKAARYIQRMLSKEDLQYKAILHRAYHEKKIFGQTLKRLLNKYKGKYWFNVKKGNKWWWTMRP